MPYYNRVSDLVLTGHKFTAGSGGVNPTPLSGLNLGVATAPLQSGRLCGLAVTLQANSTGAADYQIEIYTENSSDLTSGKVANVYTATFSFAGVGKTIVDTLSQPIPFLEQPYVLVRQTSTLQDSNTLNIKFFVEATDN